MYAKMLDAGMSESNISYLSDTDKKEQCYISFFWNGEFFFIAQIVKIPNMEVLKANIYLVFQKSNTCFYSPKTFQSIYVQCLKTYLYRLKSIFSGQSRRL